MGEPVKVGSGVNYPAYETEAGHAERPKPNETLDQMAMRLGVDPDDLAKANPQIKDPKSVLSPFQDIEVPDKLHPQTPKQVTESPTHHSGQSSLPPRPTSDPEGASAMKAQTWAVFEDSNKQASVVDHDPVSRPDEDSSQWQKQQNDLDRVSRPDQDAIAWQQDENERLDAQQRLKDLGLPPDPPKVTGKDLESPDLEAEGPDDKERLEKQKEGAKELGNEVVGDYVKHKALHRGAEIMEEVAHDGAKVARELGRTGAAEVIETAGSLGETTTGAITKASTLAVAATVVTGLIMNHLEKADARELQMPKLHGAAIRASNELMEEKFPQSRPLNRRGIDQDKAVVEQWKNNIDDKLDDIMSDMQSRQERLEADLQNTPDTDNYMNTGMSNHEGLRKDAAEDIEKLRQQLTNVLKQGTVDLANARMGVFYDPRNWDESKTGATAR